MSPNGDYDGTAADHAHAAANRALNEIRELKKQRDALMPLLKQSTIERIAKALEVIACSAALSGSMKMADLADGGDGKAMARAQSYCDWMNVYLNRVVFEVDKEKQDDE